MTILSRGQAARLTGRGTTIFARAISGRFFTGSKEEGGHNMDGAESARVYPFPALVETVDELRTRLALAEERLTELKAVLEEGLGCRHHGSRALLSSDPRGDAAVGIHSRLSALALARRPARAPTGGKRHARQGAARVH